MGAVAVLGEIWEIALLSAGLPGHPQSAERHDGGVPLEMPEWSKTATRRVRFMF